MRLLSLPIPATEHCTITFISVSVIDGTKAGHNSSISERRHISVVAAEAGGGHPWFLWPLDQEMGHVSLQGSCKEVSSQMEGVL